MRRLHRRAQLAIAMTATALVLAACEQPLDGTGGTPAASTPQTTTPTDPAVASAQPATPGAGTPEGTPEGSAEIVRSGCQQPSANQVYFNLDGTVMRVPEAAIRNTIPAGLSGQVGAGQIEEAVRARVAAGEGCPEKPLDAIMLMVEEDLGHPLLAGALGLLVSPDGSITRRFADLTRSLQQKPNQNCRALQGDLLACIGTETRGDRQTEVMYVISTDSSIIMNSGGPLAARCVLEADKIAGCNMVDQFVTGLTFDVTLAAGEYTTQGLRDARTKALAKLSAYRQ